MLLVDIESIDAKLLTQQLTRAGFNAIETKHTQYHRQQNPALVIVDVKSHGYGAITRIKAVQQGLLPNHLQPPLYPPLLAIVDVLQNDLSDVFKLGAFDYISSPLITAEFTARVSQVEHSFELVQQDCPKTVDFATTDQNPLSQDECLLAERTAGYLKSQLANDVNLDIVAGTMATNRNKLGKIFKACFGTTMFNWLREQRLLLAAELLTTDTTQPLTIVQVAQRVGYSDPNYFSTAFKNAFRLSPLQYRQQVSQKVQQSKKVVQQFKVETKTVQVD